MKTIIILLILNFICFSQDFDINEFKLYELKFDSLKIDECGDARKISSVSVLEIGFIREVLKPNEFIFEKFNILIPGREDKNKIFKRIILSGVDTGILLNQQAQFLKEYLLNILKDKEVQLLITYDMFTDSDTLYSQLVYQGKNINYSLIKNGFALHNEVNEYELDSWDRCQFKNAEKTAKSKKIGIWNN